MAAFMPHGMCFAWQGPLLALHVLSDSAIVIAYFSIPLALVRVATRRPDLPLGRMMVLFSAFIIACGVTHAFAIWTIWFPDYWIDGAAKAVTGIISIFTAIALARALPGILSLPSPQAHEAINARLTNANDRLARALALLEVQSIEEQATIDNLADGVVVLDASDTIVRSNRAAARLVPDDLLGFVLGDPSAMFGVVDEDGSPFDARRVPLRVARASDAVCTVVVGVGEASARRWLTVAATPIRDHVLAGTSRVIVTMSDVTELRVRELEQSDYARQLHTLHSIASDANARTKDRIDSALHAALEKLGFAYAFFARIDDDALVIDNSVYVDPTFPNGLAIKTRVPSDRSGLLVGTRDAIVEVGDLAKADAASFPFGSDGAYLGTAIVVDGLPYGIIGFRSRAAQAHHTKNTNVEFIRVTGHLVAFAIEQSLHRSRLDGLAFYDALTTLPNRVLLFDRLEQAIRAGSRRNEPFAVMYLDLDGFKAVNDTYGHAAGDEVLKAVSLRLRGAMRESDTVARLGGDEFVVLAPHVDDPKKAARLALSILDAIAQPIPLDGTDAAVTAGIGIALFSADGSTAQALVDAADTALRAAKLAGSNCFRFASETARAQGTIVEPLVATQSGRAPSARRSPRA